MHRTLKHTALAFTVVLLGNVPSLAESVEPVVMSAAQIQTLLTGNSLAGNGSVKDPNHPMTGLPTTVPTAACACASNRNGVNNHDRSLVDER